MAKKRKTVEASKPSLEPPQLAVMKNGRQAAADTGAGLANAKAEKMSPPAAKRKKTAKKSATPAPDSESGERGQKKHLSCPCAHLICALYNQHCRLTLYFRYVRDPEQS